MRVIISILVLLPGVIYAESPREMPPNMQMNMQQLQKAMTCMNNIDQSALERLDKEGKKIQAEVQALCRGGNRSAAQEKAIVYGREMLARPELQKMRECSKLARGMIPQMPFESIEELSNDRHVCDDFGQ